MSREAWNAWHFSDEEQQEIRNALPAEIQAKEVESLIAKLRAAVIVSNDLRARYALPPIGDLRAKSRRITNTIEKLQRELRDMSDVAPVPGQWLQDLEAMRMRMTKLAEAKAFVFGNARELRATADDLEKRGGPLRRGAPPDIHTKRLHRWIRGILKQHEIPFTKYRDGTAARLLRVCHKAATGRELEDPFRALLKA